MILTSHNKENMGHKMFHATREASSRRLSHASPGIHGRSYDLPANDFDTDDHSQNNSYRPTKYGALPKHLQRPTFRRVASDAVSFVDPDLKGVPLQFIHQKIQSVGHRLFAAATATVVRSPKGHLPRELQVIVNDVSVDIPTHLFAVYSHPSALQNQRVGLHPAHALILAANCANLPPIPAFKPRTPAFPGSTVTLPVIPLRIPSPSTFPLLLDFLYTRRAEHVLRALSPLPPHDDGGSLQQLARQLAERFTTAGLMTYIHRTQSLWSNAAALGVSDEQLWRAMDVAWEVLRGALAIRSREA